MNTAIVIALIICATLIILCALNTIDNIFLRSAGVEAEAREGELEELVYKSDVLEAINSCGGCDADDLESKIIDDTCREAYYAVDSINAVKVERRKPE